MNVLGNIFGEVCKTIFPISEEIYFGNSNSSTSICVLSSISLLKKIANSELMTNISLVGRLFSENKGIDSIIRYVNSNPNIDTIIICGKEVLGHKSGSSLLALYKNGMDDDGKIIYSTSPDPYLTVSQKEVKIFQDRVRIINKIGMTKFETISNLLKTIEN
ncbi:MAG TPA: tetrahydromethanopterin S-methyltransferase subunit A [Nitrosopumilaceae archaeon]|nr:tetrahydromethanopterin S-methyltransferase subunit A [Nitrosopumilaceae archaeon]